MYSMNWRRLLILASALVIFSVGGCQRHNVKSRNEREANYQHSLKSYSEALPVGVTRKTVEEYLRAHSVHWQQGFGPGSLDSESYWVRIGQDPAPWYCSAEGVYITFQFAAAEKHGRYDTRDSDVLKQVQLQRWGEGCL